VWEEPGYQPPAWVAEEPVGKPQSVTIESRILKVDLPALIWAHPDANERSPLLVAHDGPEYAAHSALMTYLGQQRPIRAALIGPVDRNEIYSASARYSRALAEEILPQLPAAPTRIGLGASLGALSLFHTHRRHPDSFDALFLQSGSFFRRAESYERTFPRYERIARFVGGVHPQSTGADDPGRAHLRHRRGEPGPEPGAGSVAPQPGLRRAPVRDPRWSQLGRVARLLPPATAPPASEDLT
jgi:enterochelin esterase family protein